MDDELMMPSTWPYSVDASVVVSSGVDSLNVYSTSKLGEPMVPLTLQNCGHNEHAPVSWTRQRCQASLWHQRARPADGL